MSDTSHQVRRNKLNQRGQNSTSPGEPGGSNHRPALDTALSATLDELEMSFGPVEGTARLETSLLYHYGRLVADPEALVHARLALESAQSSGEAEVASRSQAIVSDIEALQAKGSDELAALIEAALTYRATLEAQNDYVGATDMEAAYAVLQRQSGLLVTDLALQLLEGKVAELRQAGDIAGAQSLQRGPLRLVKDVRDNGLDQGYRIFLDRYRRQEEAKARLAFLLATSGSDLVEAVDAVLGAGSNLTLAQALDGGYPWLVRLEAAMIIREAVMISGVSGTGTEDVTRFEYLASVLERLSAVAEGEPGLSRQEQVQWALSLGSGGVVQY